MGLLTISDLAARAANACNLPATPLAGVVAHPGSGDCNTLHGYFKTVTGEAQPGGAPLVGIPGGAPTDPLGNHGVMNG